MSALPKPSAPDPASTPPKESFGRTLAAHVGVWAGVALAYGLALAAGAGRAGHAVDAGALAVESLSTWLPWLLLSLPAQRYLANPRHDVDLSRVLVLALFGLLLFLPAEVLLYRSLEALRAGRALPGLVEALSSLQPIGLLTDAALVIASLGCVLAWSVIRRNRHSERARQRAESELLGLQLKLEAQRLHLLQSQLEPHFLFNALSAIAALVRGQRSGDALLAISRLSELLRYALRGSRSEWVGLADEFAFIEDYLALQQLRFGDRLQPQLQLPAALHDFELPALLLQPLVENAIKHGVEPVAGDVKVVVQAQASAQGIQISIANRAGGRAARRGFGIGLGNVSERLALLYGGRARLEVDSGSDRFVVRLELPERDDD
jgi:two-component system sensor histidine kinase AlgZ